MAGCCEHDNEPSGSIKFLPLFLELMTEFILVENTGIEACRGIFSSLLLLPLLSRHPKCRPMGFLR